MSQEHHMIGAIAAGHQVTAKAAARILREGGNAFDAVIAGMMAATVAEPIFSSPGGGGFLMAHIAGQDRTTLYDFFSETPRQKRPRETCDFQAITADFGPATQEFHIGIGATAVPGQIQGLFQIHRDLADLPFKTLCQPAIEAAETGFPFPAFQAYLFTVVAPILKHSAKARAHFAPDGQLFREGDLYRNPELAHFYRMLSEQGLSFFVEGQAASDIIQQSSTHGGLIRKEDLAHYQVIERSPLDICFSKTGKTGSQPESEISNIFLNPAPAASGPLLYFGLKLMNKLQDEIKRGTLNPLTALALAQKATIDVRSAHTANLSEICDDHIINEQMAHSLAHLASYNGTTHLSVIDRIGNAASATVTNGEGNGHMVGDWGFMMNNMLGEEDLNPDGFFNWIPATRLSTMMAPTLIRTSEGTITALGSGGSNRIRTAILQVALNLLAGHMPLKEAIKAPRLHIEKCGTLSFEGSFGQSESAILEAFDESAHRWPDRNMFFGGVHGVTRHGDGRFEAFGDPRRDGVAILVEA